MYQIGRNEQLFQMMLIGQVRRQPKSVFGFSNENIGVNLTEMISVEE